MTGLAKQLALCSSNFLLKKRPKRTGLSWKHTHNWERKKAFLPAGLRGGLCSIAKGLYHCSLTGESHLKQRREGRKQQLGLALLLEGLWAFRLKLQSGVLFPSLSHNDACVYVGLSQTPRLLSYVRPSIHTHTHSLSENQLACIFTFPKDEKRLLLLSRVFYVCSKKSDLAS